MSEFSHTDWVFHTRNGEHRKVPPANYKGFPDTWRRRLKKHLMAHELHDKDTARLAPPPPPGAPQRPAPPAEGIGAMVGVLQGFGPHIREVLRSRAIPVNTIHDQLGLSRSGFHYKLRGETPFSLAEAMYLCQLLDIKLDDVVAELWATR